MIKFSYMSAPLAFLETQEHPTMIILTAKSLILQNSQLDPRIMHIIVIIITGNIQ